MPRFFYPLLALSQLLAVILLVLTGYWTGHMLGGFAWDGSPQQFNLHPLLMILGLVFLYGDGKFLVCMGSQKGQGYISSPQIFRRLQGSFRLPLCRMNRFVDSEILSFRFVLRCLKVYLATLFQYTCIRQYNIEGIIFTNAKFCGLKEKRVSQTDFLAEVSESTSKCIRW